MSHFKHFASLKSNINPLCALRFTVNAANLNWLVWTNFQAVRQRNFEYFYCHFHCNFQVNFTTKNIQIYYLL